MERKDLCHVIYIWKCHLATDKQNVEVMFGYDNILNFIQFLSDFSQKL